jgi:DNA-binding CsgD family transcriptional regulator
LIDQAKLLESIADMQLGDQTPDEWLEQFTDIVGCSAAGTIVWTGDDPKNNLMRCSENFNDFPLNWIPVAEDIITRSTSKNYDFLDDMAEALDIEDPYPSSPLHDRNLLMVFLDKGTTRSLMVLQRNDAVGWSSEERKSLSEILPGLRKANELHKLLCLTNNRLDIASKVLDGAPRGIAALTPDGHIIKANMLGLELLANKDCFTEVDGKLTILNKEVQTGFLETLALIRDTKPEYLQGLVWNRSFITKKKQMLQIIVRAYPLDSPNLESNDYDRFVALFIHTPERYIRPSAKGLQEFYGLTAAQARLVSGLLEGQSIKDAAVAQNIQINTARSHMQSIYAIMGVSGQADLMRLLGATLVNYEPPK